jgi:hypothetical protein
VTTRRFVVVSGLPASGKTTVARHVATALELPLIDKDDILERLFASKGIGDAAWRRALSRESDALLRAEAERSQGAVLASFWHLDGMPEDSGTPTAWLTMLRGRLVHVRCVCPPDMAATRFAARTRHPGHLDRDTPHATLLEGLQRLDRLAPPDLGACLDVDTSRRVAADELVRSVRAAFGQ